MKLRDRIAAFASDTGFDQVDDLLDFLAIHDLTIVSTTGDTKEYKERCLRAESRLSEIADLLCAHEEEKAHRA